MTDIRRIVDPETFVEIEVPDLVSDAEALSKERRRRDGRIETLRLMPGHGCVLPLWSAADGPLMEARSLGVPEVLDREMRQWQAAWEAGCHYLDGWGSVSAQRAWIAWGESIHERLHRILWRDFDVEPAFRRTA